MPFTPPPAKLTIGSLDDEKLNVIAQYNPAQIEHSRTTGWKPNGTDKPEARREKKSSRDVEFTGGDGRMFSLELLFDGFEQNRSVRRQVDDLDAMARPRVADSDDEELRRPHQCVIVWGDQGGKDGAGFPPVRCVIDSLTVKYTMFDPQGVLLRAVATLKLREANVMKDYDKKADEKRIDERVKFSLEVVKLMRKREEEERERRGVR
jgi:hypothetical protein